MYLLSVIPISKGIPHDTLSYFSKTTYPVGSILDVPLKSKKIKALLFNVEQVSDKKTDIKQYPFAIRNIGTTQAREILFPSFVETAKSLAAYYATTTGSILYTLISQETLLWEYTITPEEIGTNHHVLVLQNDDEERYATYKRYIRESFASKKSVLFCVPTLEDVRVSQDMLMRGIEQYTYVLHSDLSKKDLEKAWKDILAQTHPVLVICTGYFLSLPRHDIGTIIVDRENTSTYVSHIRPYADIRNIAYTYAKHKGIPLIFGDTMLRIETIWKHKQDQYGELSPLKWRLVSDARTSIHTPQEGEKFSTLSKEAHELIAHTKEHNESLFIFSSRKGLAPITLCGDCGTVVRCLSCGAPVTLYGKKGNDKENIFACHKCGTKRSAHELCSVCNSWKLTTLGIGTETIAKELHKLFPHHTFYIFDREHIKTQKEARKIIEQFYNNPGSVLVGTEMALPYLSRKVTHSIVASIDALFSLPDFHISERIMKTLLSIRARSEQTCLFHTRITTSPLFEYASQGNISDFYRDEIREREQLGYPPFSTHIKITLSGKKETVRSHMQSLQKFLLPFELVVFEAFHPKLYEHYTVHGLITLPQHGWINEDLLAKLRALPPQYKICIDPESLL